MESSRGYLQKLCLYLGTCKPKFIQQCSSVNFFLSVSSSASDILQLFVKNIEGITLQKVRKRIEGPGREYGRYHTIERRKGEDKRPFEIL